MQRPSVAAEALCDGVRDLLEKLKGRESGSRGRLRVERPLDTVRSALVDLAKHRGRPCLAIVGEIDRAGVRTLVSAIERLSVEAIDILVSGPGGDIEAAYLMDRTFCDVGSASTRPTFPGSPELAELGKDDLLRGEAENRRCALCESAFSV